MATTLCARRRHHHLCYYAARDEIIKGSLKRKTGPCCEAASLTTKSPQSVFQLHRSCRTPCRLGQYHTQYLRYKLSPGAYSEELIDDDRHTHSQTWL